MNSTSSVDKYISMQTEIVDRNAQMTIQNMMPHHDCTDEDEQGEEQIQKNEITIQEDKSIIKQSSNSMLSQIQFEFKQKQKRPKPEQVLAETAIINQDIQIEENKQQVMNQFSLSPPYLLKTQQGIKNVITNSPQLVIKGKNNGQVQILNEGNPMEDLLSYTQYNQLQSKKSLINISLIIKLMKAIKLFKQYLTRREINIKHARIIKDITFYDVSNTKVMSSKNKNNSLKQAYHRYIQHSSQKNQIHFLFKQIKDEVKTLKIKLLLFLDNQCPVINAVNPWKIFYDIIKIIITMFAVFLNTVEVFFDINFDEMYPDLQPKLRYLFIGFYSMSMFLSLNTAISQKGLIVSTRKDIFKHYFQKRFLPDTLSIISFIRFYNIKKIVTEIIKLFILSQVISISINLFNNQIINNLLFKITLLKLQNIIQIVIDYMSVKIKQNVGYFLN